MGCIGRLGCLVVIVVVAIMAWLTHDQWLPRLTGAPAATTAGAVVWEPLTDAGAERGRTAVASLAQKRGPVFTNLAAGDLASYVFASLKKQLPPSARDTRAAVIGERLYVKSLVKLSDFGPGALGSMASFLPSEDTLMFGGTFDVVQPGLAEYRVEELKMGRLSLPQSMIPKLLARMRTGGARDKLAPNGLALEVPRTIGDVRIGKGKVTLYKTTNP